VTRHRSACIDAGMPRVGRLYQRALCYHVMNRGVNRCPLYGDDQDRKYFSQLVGEYKEACGARVYHWVWMGTHYHMVVEVVYENLRGFVGGIQQAYAQYHHARYNGTGVFWQGRFKSRPVGSANRSTCTVLTHPQRHPHAGKSLSRPLHACRIHRNQVRQSECLDPASRVGHREECLCGKRQLGRSVYSSAYCRFSQCVRRSPVRKEGSAQGEQ
jgi:hypothetical protein